MTTPALLGAAALVLLAACSGGRTAVDAPAASTSAPRSDATYGMGVSPDDRATPAERADRQTLYLTERLSLRDDQVAPVRAVALEYAERQAALRQEPRGDRRERMQAMRALSQEQDGAYRAILDDAQYTELQAVREEVRAQMRERLSERRGRRG